ncbi:MAG: hypothetical protein ABI268_08745 [Rhodanobacter sp.]
MNSVGAAALRRRRASDVAEIGEPFEATNVHCLAGQFEPAHFLHAPEQTADRLDHPVEGVGDVIA